MSDRILVHIGGSWVKLKKQDAAFAAAGIELDHVGYIGHGHYSNYEAIMPDTQEAKELLKKVGGSVCRRQWLHLKESKQEKMF